MIKVETIGMLDVAKVNPVMLARASLFQYGYVHCHGAFYSGNQASYKAGAGISVGFFVY